MMEENGKTIREEEKASKKEEITKIDGQILLLHLLVLSS